MSAVARVRRIQRALTSLNEPMILMYHRIASIHKDPWGNAVTPGNFRQQIAALSELRHVVPLKTLVSEARRGSGKGMVAITFDDGYLDNLTEAYPILEEFKCPATMFITAGIVEGIRSFWWDGLTSIIYDPLEIPGYLNLDIEGRVFTWEKQTSRMWINPASWRRSLYNELWRFLRDLHGELRENAMDELAKWAGLESTCYRSSLLMTKEQVKQVSRSGLVDIGAHTMTHPSLPSLTEEEQFAEISRSRHVCEEVIGRPVETFAYPYGNFSKITIEAVRRAGLRVACSTEPGVVKPGCDPLIVPREYVGNYSGEAFRWKIASNFALPAL
jgi:peptidoglycan/xylan/chitin deacetylase (PgdA/CDA1 family)